jgi:voltage-gated potassium channel
MGRVISERLAASGLPVVVIDRDPEAIETAARLGLLAVEGLASDDDTLELAGLARASHLVSALDSESDNIVVTLTARATRPDIRIFARGDGDSAVRKLRRAGADRVTSPYASAGVDMADAIVRPGVSEFIARTSHSGSDIALAEISIDATSPLVGLTLKRYGLESATRISFVMLERHGTPPLIPPSGRETFRDGDVLIVAGDPEQISMMSATAAGENGSAKAA